MQSASPARIDIAVNGLITFSGEKSSRSNNLCDEPIGAVESTTFLHQLDENEVIRCCALLAYQLRLKHNIVYQFDSNSLNSTQLKQFEIFNRISCFNEYIELCKSFFVCFRYCNDVITAKFSRESTRRNEVNQSRKRQSNGTFVSEPQIEQDPDKDDEFQELQSVYEQLQNMRKVFDCYFQMFVGDDFDRYVIYEKIYLDTCLSADVPLIMQLSDFSDLAVLFASLLRLTLVSTDFCNSQFSAFFGNGMMLNMLLYLTIDEVLRDATGSLSKQGRTHYGHWTRLTLLSKADQEAACLLRDIDSEAYQRAIEALPPEQFNPSLGHIYMSKSDTLATLFVQFITRLFMRLYEWPERRDVKPHLLDKYVCDNIASYFLKTGRGQQHNWIKFFKRKRQDRKQNTPTPSSLINAHNDHKSSHEPATHSLFDPLLPPPVESNKILPQIFINLPALHALYDLLSQGVPKNNNKRTRLDTSSSGDPFTQPSNLAVMANAQVKYHWEALEAFKRSYITFFINGAVQRDTFRQWYQQMCITFILRSGGYHGFCQAQHPRVFSFEANLSHIYSPECQRCTESLYSHVNSDRSGSIFSLERWAKEVHTLLFPYNFMLISADFIKNNRVLSDDTLRDAWALKTQELLVSCRFTADKCLRCHAYFCQLEKRSRLIVEEQQLRGLFISAMEQLPFMRDLMDFDQQPSTAEDTMNEEDEVNMS